MPADSDESEVREGGRGLMLVDAVTEQWSWYFAHGTGGKVVWASCAGEGEHMTILGGS